MSNHLHMITRRNNEQNLTELLGRFKSVSSKKFIKEINNNPQESRIDWLLYQFNYFANKNSQNITNITYGNTPIIQRSFLAIM